MIAKKAILSTNRFAPTHLTSTFRDLGGFKGSFIPEQMNLIMMTYSGLRASVDMHFYHYYGLTVSSDLPIPELIPLSDIPSDSNIDVKIARGKVSLDGLPDGNMVSNSVQATARQLWLSIPDVARFLISNGNEIIYEPIGNYDADSLRLYLLGSCTGALLYQRDFLILHGNAFQVGDGCVICVGGSGAGKSTLVASMMQRGHKIISDDVCPIDDQGRAVPGMPRIKLWQDSADKLNINTKDLKRVRPGLNKFNYPLGNAFCEELLPVRAIYILDSHEVSDFKVVNIEGMKRFLPLHNNTYRLAFLNGMHKKTQHLKQCSELAKHIHVRHLYRPKNAFLLDELGDCILADLERQDVIQIEYR